MRLLIKDRSKFPKCIRHFAELKGICVGTCINKNKTISTDDVHAVGHAHAHFLDPHNGWVCLMYKSQLKEKYTLLHEVAHLIANRYNAPDHGKEWRKAVSEIGGTFKSYPAVFNRNLEYGDFTHTDPSNKKQR